MNALFTTIHIVMHDYGVEALSYTVADCFFN